MSSLPATCSIRGSFPSSTSNAAVGKGRPTGEGVHGTLRQPRRRLDNGSLHRGYIPESRQGEALRTWSAAATVLLIIPFWVLAGPTAVRAQPQGAASSAPDAAPIDLTG